LAAKHWLSFPRFLEFKRRVKFVD